MNQLEMIRSARWAVDFRCSQFIRTGRCHKIVPGRDRCAGLGNLGKFGSLRMLGKNISSPPAKMNKKTPCKGTNHFKGNESSSYHQFSRDTSTVFVSFQGGWESDSEVIDRTLSLQSLNFKWLVLGWCMGCLVRCFFGGFMESTSCLSKSATFSEKPFVSCFWINFTKDGSFCHQFFSFTEKSHPMFHWVQGPIGVSDVLLMEELLHHHRPMKPK